ncbi:hypothetical protein DEO72_LG6g1484 [Vigna unguiculata]|uniref:Uncharacterized protein n=1 Tax=Vigna unguiculata TaxID=3917 RepID=A0A4D6MAD4_VIGUN|nr:hypothetical protein DEO72_LG6g1484 [Vigna unguiculata]
MCSCVFPEGPRVAEPGEEEESYNDKCNEKQVQIETVVEGDELSLLEIIGYEWVLHELKDFATRYRLGNDLGYFTEQHEIFWDDVEDGSL